MRRLFDADDWKSTSGLCRKGQSLVGGGDGLEQRLGEADGLASWHAVVVL